MDPTEHEPVTFQIKIKRKKTVFFLLMKREAQCTVSEMTLNLKARHYRKNLVGLKLYLAFIHLILQIKNGCGHLKMLWVLLPAIFSCKKPCLFYWITCLYLRLVERKHPKYKYKCLSHYFTIDFN